MLCCDMNTRLYLFSSQKTPIQSTPDLCICFYRVGKKTFSIQRSTEGRMCSCLFLVDRGSYVFMSFFLDSTTVTSTDFLMR